MGTERSLHGDTATRDLNEIISSSRAGVRKLLYPRACKTRVICRNATLRTY